MGADCAPWLNDHVRLYWLGCGQALDEFNTHLIEDSRIDVIILPVFDGVTHIKWKASAMPTKNGTNGHSA